MNQDVGCGEVTNRITHATDDDAVCFALMKPLPFGNHILRGGAP